MSDAVLGRAAVEIGADWSKLEGDLNKAGTAVEQKFASAGKTMRNVGTALTAGVTVPLGAFITKSVMAAARVDELDIVVRELGKTAGYTEGEISGHVQAVADMGIEAAASREIIAKFVTAQLDAADAAGIARIAQDQAVISGENSTDTTVRLTDALITGNAQMFRSMRMNIDLGDSYELMASQLGKNVDELTEAERVQARVNAVTAYGATITGTYEAAMGDSFKQMGSFKRYLDDIFVAMGQYFTPALNTAVFALGDMLKVIPSLIKEGGSFAPVLESWGKAASNVAENFKSILTKLQDMDPALIQTAGQIIGLTAVIGPLLMVGGQMLIWTSKLTTAMGVLTGGMGAAKGASLALSGPIGLVAAGLIALGVGYTYAYNKGQAVEEGLKTQQGTITKTTDTYEAYIAAQRELAEEAGRTLYVLEEGERVHMAGSQYITALSEAAWEAAKAHQELTDKMIVSDDHMVKMAMSGNHLMTQHYETTKEIREAEKATEEYNRLMELLTGTMDTANVPIDVQKELMRELGIYTGAVWPEAENLEAAQRELTQALIDGKIDLDTWVGMMDDLGDSATTGWQELRSVVTWMDMVDGMKATATFEMVGIGTTAHPFIGQPSYTPPPTGQPSHTPPTTGQPSYTPPADDTDWINAGGLAAGGPVFPDNTYLVGERGIELFQPSVPGNIISNHELRHKADEGGAGASGVVNNYNLTANYPMQSELSLLERIRIMEAINA